MQNIELKARLKDLPRARQIAGEIATQHLAPQHQVDTYFSCRFGRLKLREIDGVIGQLIAYQRPDENGPKASNYQVIVAPDPKSLKDALATTLGVLAVIEKHREIYLWHNVRIHLDDVVGLGAFLEFEAVLDPTIDTAAGHAQVAELTKRFGVEPADLLPGSYGEMLAG